MGKGFSGDIEGHRAKISNFSLSDFTFKNPIVSFPDSNSIKNVKLVENRIGSVGGEVLKRFTIVLDYAGKTMYLKKNNKFNEPFSYNKSGITIQHNGLQWVQETVHLETVRVSNATDESFNGKNNNDFRYKFQLKPIFEIVNVREKSAAEKSGLQKGDVIVSINDTKPYKYTLQQINNLLKSEEDIWINLEVERNSVLLKFRFRLEDEL
ncbi:PDZ domain-containing protein [Flavobacterium sp. RS13.1]|uniref:PDZ domain-containing protein n=1 Tax=Flavobacterium sp. RS13.1 TaxID=3400345 RepID=UPI003AABEF8C